MTTKTVKQEAKQETKLDNFLNELTLLSNKYRLRITGRWFFIDDNKRNENDKWNAIGVVQKGKNNKNLTAFIEELHSLSDKYSIRIEGECLFLSDDEECSYFDMNDKLMCKISMKVTEVNPQEREKDIKNLTAFVKELGFLSDKYRIEINEGQYCFLPDGVERNTYWVNGGSLYCDDRYDSTPDITEYQIL